MSGTRRTPWRSGAHPGLGASSFALGFFAFFAFFASFAFFGCNRAVIQVETEPGDAAVTIDKNPARGDRWSLKKSTPVKIVATWPEGEQVRAELAVERDVVVVLRRDGDADNLTGGWLLAASGPRGQANLAPPPADDDDDDAKEPAAVVVEEPPPKGSTEDAFARARELFAEGQKAFELADYDLAIANFKEAYELIRSSPTEDTAEILTNVIFNLAVVYEKSYELTPQAERLRKARIMYSQYDEQMAQLVEGWGSSTEAGDVRARIRAIEARIEALPAGS